jgi:alkanesulfonate monooxygenase SsuD/methylene tetrahydromethanopterin reductase-like flavin-dependent oxidoreductase (luciferase family)
MAAGSPDSIRKVARRGYKLLLDQLASTTLAIERFNIYKAEVEACGRTFDPMDVGVCRAFYVAKDADDKARRSLRGRIVAAHPHLGRSDG